MKRILAALFLCLWATHSFAASTEKWIAGSGQGLTWGDACGIPFTGTPAVIASGNAILCGTDITNGTPLDIFADFSISLASVTTPAGALWAGIYIYPKNEDGTTYGDGRFGTAAAGPPDASYQACSIYVVPSVTAAIVGSCRGVVLPPGTYRVVFYDGFGVNTASSGNVLDYRTYNRQQQ